MNEKGEFTKEELDLMKKQKHLNFAQSSISAKSVGETSLSRSGISFNQLQSALQDPYSNVAMIQQISKILYHTNGVYYRLVEMFANIPMYDLFLSPTAILGFNGKNNAVDKMNKEYEQIAQLVEKTNYKYNFKWFGRQLLIYGELFVYKVEDNAGVFYKVMPNDMCRVSGIMENNILKYSIDLSKLNDAELLSTMPLPIQKLYERYNSGALKNDEKLVDSYYYLEENEAVAFLYDDGNVRTKGVPPFSYLFDKLYRLDEIEDEELSNSASDNLKLIVQKPQTNEEGELLMDIDLITMYHNAIKKNLPKGVGVVTSPMPIEALTLQRQASSTLTATQKAYESVYTTSGTNSELFNGQRSSNESVLNSIKTDEMVVDRLNLIFCNFINYEIKNKKRNAMWKVEMLRNTYFNKKEMQASCRDDAVLGLGKLRYLASLGYTPLTALSVLYYESESQMETLFKPLASGYNSGATSEDNGRPSNAEDDTNPHNAGQSEN
jgi:hypothetical protein